MRILSVVYETILDTHNDITKRTTRVLADASPRPGATSCNTDHFHGEFAARDD